MDEPLIACPIQQSERDLIVLVATATEVFSLQETEPESILSGEPAALIEDIEGPVIVTRSGRIAFPGKETESHIDHPIECAARAGADLLIGTEGPHIYRHTSGTTEKVETFDQLECRDTFHTPWGGPASVRSFASTCDGVVYADIHVGSVMRSPDSGAHWEPVTPDLHEDVHQVATTGAAPDRLYANTAHGVYLSDDRGGSWTHRSTGFPYLYGRAVAVHPEDPECALASVSRGPHGNPAGQLYRTDDAGMSWRHVTNGYPDTVDRNIDTFQIGFSNDGRSWATAADGLYVSEDRGQAWDLFWTAPNDITLIACN